MPEKIRLLKVLVSCPNDVEKEKNQVRRACKTLTEVYLAPKLKIEVIDWKNNVSPIITGENPQKVINEQLKEYDVYLGILWKRFGDKQENGKTPTEEEFERALASFKEKGRPIILMYFKTDNYYPKDSVEAEQTLQVIKFKEKIKSMGLFREFKEDEEFSQIVTTDLGTKINTYEWLRTI